MTIIGGLQSPSQGEVRLNGQAFSQKKEKARAKMRFDQIGFILQASNLVPFLKIKDQLRLVDKLIRKNSANRLTAFLTSWVLPVSQTNILRKFLAGKGNEWR